MDDDQRIEWLSLLGKTAEQFYNALANLPKAAERGTDAAAEYVAILVASYGPQIDACLKHAGRWLKAGPVEVLTPMEPRVRKHLSRSEEEVMLPVYVFLPGVPELDRRG